MTPEATSDRQILSEIERLRAQFSDTQELYREVCVLLFFRLGITPTANKLYQLVRKGSMSAPAEALERFWDNLREKSRVRIEHPDLPDELKTAAGELVAALWSKSQTSAHEALAIFREEAQTSIVEAQVARDTSEKELTVARKEFSEVRQSIQLAQDRTLELERQLAGERASKGALSEQLELAGRQQIVLEKALAEARHEFTGELEKMRQALQLSEERHDASEKRILLEIDRERITAAKLQKELMQLRQNNSDITEQHRSEIAEVQRQLGEARQNVGVAEGSLQEMRATFQQQANQLQSLRTSTAERDTQYALLLREMGACRANEMLLEQELAPLREKQVANTAPTSPKPKRTRKKTG